MLEKDIEFFSKIRVTYIVKSAKREADKASNKAERFVKIFDWQTVTCESLIELIQTQQKEGSFHASSLITLDRFVTS